MVADIHASSHADYLAAAHVFGTLSLVFLGHLSLTVICLHLHQNNSSNIQPIKEISKNYLLLSQAFHDQSCHIQVPTPP